jgi:hypothetical protein
MFRFFVTLVLCAFACACAGTGDGSSGSGQHSLEPGTPGRVTLVDYRTSNRLTLVNEAHTDPSTLYTEKRDTASIKVTSNEVFKAMLGHFEDEGFSSSSSTGYAPIIGGEGLRKAIEVETGGGVRHMLLDLQNPKANYETLQACTTAFIQLYNLTDQNQAISNDGGKALFDDQQRALSERSKKQKLGLGLQ